MASKLRFGNVVLCEYIASGQGNKQTLVNVYAGDIVVREFPAKLRLSVYAEYTKQTDESFNVLVEVRLGGRTYAKLSALIEVERPGRVGIMALPSMEVGIDKELFFEVVVKAEGERACSILKKRIVKGEVSSA